MNRENTIIVIRSTDQKLRAIQVNNDPETNQRKVLFSRKLSLNLDSLKDKIEIFSNPTKNSELQLLVVVKKHQESLQVHRVLLSLEGDESPSQKIPVLSNDIVFSQSNNLKRKVYQCVVDSTGGRFYTESMKKVNHDEVVFLKKWKIRESQFTKKVTFEAGLEKEAHLNMLDDHDNKIFIRLINPQEREELDPDHEKHKNLVYFGYSTQYYTTNLSNEVSEGIKVFSAQNLEFLYHLVFNYEDLEFYKLTGFRALIPDQTDDSTLWKFLIVLRIEDQHYLIEAESKIEIEGSPEDPEYQVRDYGCKGIGEIEVGSEDQKVSSFDLENLYHTVKSQRDLFKITPLCSN